ncbi:helix-turn-helix transcriptional regulator [uncultured Acetobacteroides sp.]|uniref:helix-turn-helix domain-containing protein n=1 Tax=uncultured Acetobacteroides sp. TaxID=1760811 RepID=UPI0029F56809|nr:helix-turn-helix transcriptional regulator [uncultured Acetobacteroides sp.]
MLKLDISRVLLLKGGSKPFTFLLKLGYKRAKAFNMANNRNSSVALHDLEQICLRLNCTPNDVLEWTPSKSEDDIANHALQSIRRKDNAVGLVKLVEGLPAEEMAAVEQFIRERAKK